MPPTALRRRLTRRRVTRAAAVPVLAVTAALIAAFAWPVRPVTVSSPSWQLKSAIQYGFAGNHSQYDVVLSGRGGTWFFGGSNTAGRGVPVILRRASGLWQPQTLPPQLHSWIIAASAQSPTNIWAVTYLRGDVLRWNGSNWSSVPRGRWKSGTQFTGITADGPASVWLFGASGRTNPGAGTWHWDGTQWSRVTGIAGGIARASAVQGEIWAIGGVHGSMNALLERTGTSWRRVRPASLAGFRYTGIAAFGSGDVWVGGSASGAPKLAHFDGHSWKLVRMPGSVAATGFCHDGHGGLWAIANAANGRSAPHHRSRSGKWTTPSVNGIRPKQVLACARILGSGGVWGAGLSAGRSPRGSAAAGYGFGSVP